MTSGTSDPAIAGLLMVLGDKPVTIKRLASDLEATQAIVLRVAGAAEEAGLVSIDRPDGRMARVSITEAGRQAISRPV